MARQRTDIFPRITASVSWTMHDELKKISDNIDFSKPIFEGRSKRNRSLGSALALVAEIAMTDDKISALLHERLRGLMIAKGKHWTPHIWYRDKY